MITLHGAAASSSGGSSGMRAGAFFAPTDPHAYISGAVGSRFGVRRVTFPFHSPEFPTGAVFEGFTKCVVRADGGQEWRLIMSALRSELPQGDIHFGAFGLGDSPPPRVYLEVGRGPLVILMGPMDTRSRV